MKIVKVVGVVVASVIVIFFSVGVFFPSFSYTTQIEVHAPREYAFEVFNDPFRLGEWMQGFKSIETISGQPNKVGSRYRLVIVDNGEEMVMIGEITAFQENERFAFRLINDVLVANAEVKFEGSGKQTIVTDQTRVEGRTFWWRSLLPLFKSVMAARTHENYSRLQQIIESDLTQKRFP